MDLNVVGLVVKVYRHNGHDPGFFIAFIGDFMVALCCLSSRPKEHDNAPRSCSCLGDFITIIHHVLRLRGPQSTSFQAHEARHASGGDVGDVFWRWFFATFPGSDPRACTSKTLVSTSWKEGSKCVEHYCLQKVKWKPSELAISVWSMQFLLWGPMKCWLSRFANMYTVFLFL